jgi:glutamate-1-semialdehyde 2,1-aminomutase
VASQETLTAPSAEGFIVTHPVSGAPYRMGEQEHFLFEQLLAGQTWGPIAASFQERFGEPLPESDLNEFAAALRAEGLLAAPAPEDGEPEEVRAFEARFAGSGVLYGRARAVIAGATTHDRREFGPFPVYVDRADGPRKWDVQGQPLIDYWMGHGALLMGHGFGPVVEAVTRQALRSTHPGACHELEVRWAETVCRLIPSAERVRFTASGTEATLLALRIARAFTGRRRVVKLERHFHGWHDEAMAHYYPAESAGISPGAEAWVTVARGGGLDAIVAELEKGDVAAVFLEPGGGSSGTLPWSAEFLGGLRQATRDHGSLLLFDEVITGFRVGPGGIQAVCGVLPDLTTLAKILCGGLPGGAVAGRAEVMAVFGHGARRGARLAQVPHTGTFNGNPLSAAAGIALLDHIAGGAPQEKARLAAERLAALINAQAEAQGIDVRVCVNDWSIYHLHIGARAAGLPVGPTARAVDLHRLHPERYARLRRALLLEGVDTHPAHGWVSAVHEDGTLEETAEAFGRAFRRLRGAPGFCLE